MKHHARIFPCEELTHILNKFYVDNLVKTSKSLKNLLHFVLDSVGRMAKGNFILRSQNNSNCVIKDGKYVPGDCELENMEGYR